MWNNNPNQPNQGQWGNVQPVYGATSLADRSGLVGKVMTFTFFSIIAAMAGTWAGMQMNLRFGMGTWILIFIAEIALIFGTYAFKEKTPINFIMLYGFAMVTGLTLSPTIGILTKTGNADIVYQALAITAGVTIALSAYAWTTKQDFSGFAPYLFVGVIGLILVGLLNGLLFHSSVLNMVYLYAGVVIFSFYLIFDVQRARKMQADNSVGTAIVMTINIYLDILNLFLFILRLLASSRN